MMKLAVEIQRQFDLLTVGRESVLNEPSVCLILIQSKLNPCANKTSNRLARMGPRRIE